MHKLSELSKGVHMIGCDRTENPTGPLWKGPDKKLEGESWKITLGYNGRLITFDCFRGRNLGEPMDSSDFLGTLISDAEGADVTSGFEDFCESLGFDKESKAVKRMYEGALQQKKQMEEFLGEDFQMFMEAENDL